jgi:hypothetical protein
MFRTVLDGAVTLETDGRSILVQTNSGRRRLMKVLRLGGPIFGPPYTTIKKGFTWRNGGNGGSTRVPACR